MFAWEPMMTYSAAWALIALGRLEEAEQIAHETLEKAQRHNAVGAQGWAYLVLAFLSNQQERWQAASSFADKAADIATMMNENDLRARVFWCRSIGAGRQDKWERAVEYSLEALHIAQGSDVVSLVYPYLLLQAAEAYFHTGKIESAQHYLDQAMQFAHEHQYHQLPAIGLRLQACILHMQKRFEQAESAFVQALSQLDELNDAVEYVRTQQAYGQFLHATGGQMRYL